MMVLVEDIGVENKALEFFYTDNFGDINILMGCGFYKVSVIDCYLRVCVYAGQDKGYNHDKQNFLKHIDLGFYNFNTMMI
jgi:hypothetical protein